MSVIDPDEHRPLVLDVGIPAAQDRRPPKVKQRAVNFILASTLFERIAFYAFINTLFTTLRNDDPFHWNTQHSKTASYIFAGISYTSTLLFAIISDWKLGRAGTISIGFVLYLLGFIVMTITTTGSTFLCHINGTNRTHHLNETSGATSIGEEKCAPTIIATLVFTALGAGAIKSNLVVLGAEQIQDDESNLSSRYFDKYAVVINLGSAVAILVEPYVQHILVHHDYYIPYLVTVVAIVIAAILFFIGWRYYLLVNLRETVIFNCIPAMFNGCRVWCAFRRNRGRENTRRQSGGNREDMALNRRRSPSNVSEIEESMSIEGRSVLDFAKIPNGGRFLDRHVDEVKSLRLALVVFAMLIPFWLVYDQVGATFQSQAEQMRRPDPSFIGSWVSLGDPLIVIFGIVILNLIVYKYCCNSDRPLSITTKFLLGMAFAFASMCVAGIVEYFRQKQCTPDSRPSQLSVYVQLPQNILIGFSQLFGMVGSYEYAYFAAPRSGQSLFMSLHFCAIGLSFMLGTIYINVFPRPDVNIDFKCQTQYEQWYWSFYTYFFNIAGLQLIFMILFFVCQKKFTIVTLNRQKLRSGRLRR